MTAVAHTPRHPARAEVVGSLLRPPRLLAAMDELYGPGHLVAYAEDRARDRSLLDAMCGFASEAQGNLLSEDEQWRKLELVGSVAARVWG
jgi:hypothetical protein